MPSDLLPSEPGRSRAAARGRRSAFALVSLRVPLIAVGTLLTALAACGYSFRSQLAPHLNTLYIPTLVNETSEFQLTQTLTDALTREFLNRSSLRPGTEDAADAELRGTISGFDERAVTFESGEDVRVFTRQVVITLDVELLDRVENRTIWSNPNLSEFGEFTESEGRDRGVERAIVKIAETILSHAAQDF
ncbi:MAG: LptE family protein [Gemmatimonadetes bacterium]|nr:LptE family protein [Gemmatimonadota bacterium]